MLLEGNLKGFQHLGIPVVNITKAKNWYTCILGFQVVYETVIQSETGPIEVAFLKLKDIIIELYQLPEEELEDIKTRDHGHIDHLAISVSDMNKVLYTALAKGALLDSSTPNGPILLVFPYMNGLLFVNLLGPTGERVQLVQQLDFIPLKRKNTIKGWSHLGIVVSDINRSKMFYKNLGFKEVINFIIHFPNCVVKESVLENYEFRIKLIQPTGKYLKEVGLRKDGHIDHVSLKVDDVEKAFQELKNAGLNVVQDSPVFLPFWTNGMKYFNILGPDGEKIEFSQIL